VCVCVCFLLCFSLCEKLNNQDDVFCNQKFGDMVLQLKGDFVFTVLFRVCFECIIWLLQGHIFFMSFEKIPLPLWKTSPLKYGWVKPGENISREIRFFYLLFFLAHFPLFSLFLPFSSLSLPLFLFFFPTGNFLSKKSPKEKCEEYMHLWIIV